MGAYEKTLLVGLLSSLLHPLKQYHNIYSNSELLMSKPSKPSPKKSQRESSVAKPISLSPLTFKEAVSDLLKVKPPKKQSKPK